jgi:hypothetical protein
VLHSPSYLPVRVGVFVGGALTDKLFAALWVLTLAEPREIFSRDRTGNGELCREAPLPLAGNLPAL